MLGYGCKVVLKHTNTSMNPTSQGHHFTELLISTHIIPTTQARCPAAYLDPTACSRPILLIPPLVCSHRKPLKTHPSRQSRRKRRRSRASRRTLFLVATRVEIRSFSSRWRQGSALCSIRRPPAAAICMPTQRSVSTKATKAARRFLGRN